MTIVGISKNSYYVLLNIWGKGNLSPYFLENLIMKFATRNSIFDKLYANRNKLFLMYMNTVTIFEKDTNITQLENVVFELTGKHYNFYIPSNINNAISQLVKYRASQRHKLDRLLLDIRDYKSEYNSIVSALSGLRQIEYKNNNCSEEDLNDIVAYEICEANTAYRATRELRVAEVELTKTLYDLYNRRFMVEVLCKIIKSVVSKLHRHRNVYCA